MTKKEYFASDLCSQKSKTLKKAGWIVFGVCAGLSALGAVIAAIIFAIVLNNVDFAKCMDYVLEYIQGADRITYNELSEEFGELEGIFGISAGEFVKIVFAIAVITAVLAWVTTIILSFFAAYKRNLAVAILAVIFSAFCGSFLLLGSAITLLVFVCIYNKEYKNYCEAKTE